ncbi:hypothetical protein PHISP_06484 [Aspergillus sp. HF37]|nr:hypothetical protein PHISP_06484 [Aspergillus sp. HF37]
MHKPSLKELVYNALIPHPGPTDPMSFNDIVTRHLAREVRCEVKLFYGSVGGGLEAQYPGLDYTHAPHRMRLGRFHWHSGLFKAFDALGLTNTEISSICTWDGTKAVRERYEKESGVKVRDTTAEHIKRAPRVTPSVELHFLPDDNGKYTVPVEKQEPVTASAGNRAADKEETATEPVNSDAASASSGGDTELIDDRGIDVPDMSGAREGMGIRRIRILPPERSPSPDLPLPHWMFDGDEIDPVIRQRTATYLSARMGNHRLVTLELLSSLSHLPRPPWEMDGAWDPPGRQQIAHNHLRERVHAARQRETTSRVAPGRPRSAT